MLGKMKELMEMKKQADRIKKELDQITAEVTDVNGIRIIINGSQDFRYIEIDDNLLNIGNKAKLEKDLLKAMNAAIKKSQTMAAEKMRAVLPNFPGM
jgi:DNA-binding YbaB/EbfC family protein